ncbi:hypothetical protein LHEH8_06030 [Lactobacillus helveticus]|uniref:Uncharacterized protein n=1 Tax=Lactobacillus helveticus TaxID=1587 RepID=A0A8H9F7A1_LACHE|nr:hypothetical protein IV62_GL001126 [Lactobacillus helveticus]GFO98847.1 hypothetical protein LHEH8_06030 [Lactobacillus helveticus]GFP02032.1 hypothetical protein LHEW6_18650 [Lactobacillus helveticus]GFP03426.1 hypothetical protein LHEY10_13550 [Lactobacillus helveticus]GFP04190.1 hypothetical protein LMG22465_02030 [Lactobacillus helveticus]
MQELHLTQEWDKVFPKSDQVDHKKVTFTNHFGITLAADQYTPKNYTGKLPTLLLLDHSVQLRNNQAAFMLRQWMKRAT